MMTRIITILLIASYTVGCATIFSVKKQKVNLRADKESSVYIDGKPMVRDGDGNAIIERKGMGVTSIKSVKPGYKDYHHVVWPSKNRPLKYVSYLFGILPGLMDASIKGKKYASISLQQKTEELPERTENQKYIYFDELSVLVEDECYALYTHYFSLDPTAFKGKKTSYLKYLSDDIPINESGGGSFIFRTFLDHGYVDTSGALFSHSVNEKVYLSAEIEKCVINRVRQGSYPEVLKTALTIKWEFKDIYGNQMLEATTKTESDVFAENSNSEYNPFGFYNRNQALTPSIEDAIEYAIIELLDDTKTANLLRTGKVKELDSTNTKITLAQSSSYVKTMEQAIESSALIKTEEGHGSGFVIGKDGYIVTNYHVIAPTKKDLVIALNDSVEYDKVKVVSISKEYDLALLKIEATDLVPFNVTSKEKLNVSDPIYTIGTPSGLDLSRSLTKGVVSGFRKNDFDQEFIQIDASINSGNSGGPVIDRDGNLYGIVRSKLMGIGIEGVSFAIPADIMFAALKIEQR